MVLIAVQDGMEESDLEHVVGRNVGPFVGGVNGVEAGHHGTTGKFCRHLGIYYHVARENTGRRVWMTVAGADSINGSSASRFAVTLPMLGRAASQPDLFAA
jgi:hypothetical protein